MRLQRRRRSRQGGFPHCQVQLLPHRSPGSRPARFENLHPHHRAKVCVVRYAHRSLCPAHNRWSRRHLVLPAPAAVQSQPYHQPDRSENWIATLPGPRQL